MPRKLLQKIYKGSVNMPTYEGLRLKILKIRRKSFANYRKRKLVNKNFTIISNNCWGGMIYESYNLQKQSPTVVLYFMPNDYIKFLKNIRDYINYDLKFISINESKWKDIILKNDSKAGQYPIGKLNDVEIFFLHYSSKEEALDKWNRRCKRINWKKIIYKFNDQNGCTEDDVRDFLNLKNKNKLFFTVRDWKVKKEDYIKIKQYNKVNHIMASYEPFGKNRYIDLEKFINNL